MQTARTAMALRTAPGVLRTAVRLLGYSKWRGSVVPSVTSAPRRMYRAAVCSQVKQPLEVKEVELPPVTQGKVLIAVDYASVIFADTLICQGTYQEKPPLPFVPGFELAGRVAEVGEGVSNVKKGDSVVAMAQTGGFAEYCLLDSERIFPLPETISASVAVSTLTSYGTAMLAIKRRAQVKEGETVLVTAAAGGTGLAAVDIAAHLIGAKVIGVCGGAAKCQLVKERGATHAIDYNVEDVRERVKELTGGKGVNVVLDHVGGDIFTQCLRSMEMFTILTDLPETLSVLRLSGLAQEGRIVTIGYASGKIPNIPANYLLLKSCTVMGVYWGKYAVTNPHVFMQSINDSFQGVVDGKLHPYHGLEFSLSQVNEALKSVADRTSTGRVILKIREE